MKRYLLLAGALAFAAGCSGNGSGSSSTGSTGSTAASGSSTNGGSTGRSSGSSTTGQSTTGNCSEITLGAFQSVNTGFGFFYQAPSITNVGISAPDNGAVELYDDAPGTYPLATSPDNNYATCNHCVRFFEDNFPDGGLGKQFFQSGGTMVVTQADSSQTGIFKGSLSDVTLQEVIIDIDAGFTSIPVDGGACLHIASATIDSAPPPPPDAGPIPASWVCDPTFYNASDGCDCGCGAPDPDCVGTTDVACDFCDNCPGGGDGADGGCVGFVQASDNSQCIVTSTSTSSSTGTSGSGSGSGSTGASGSGSGSGSTGASGSGSNTGSTGASGSGSGSGSTTGP